MKILAIACVCNLLVIFNAESCTRLFWNDNNQAKIVGRTMDLFCSDEPEMWVNPRGINRSSSVDENALAWTSLHGSVSISAFHLKDFTTDGMNEHGLAVHLLALQATKYENRDSRPGLHYGEWPQYLLDTCRSVQEALDAHAKFQVVPIASGGLVWPLHLIIEDATGDSAIIEFIDGQMKVYHGTGHVVATNDPTYDEQCIHLASFENFGGTLPLPTKTYSSDRFVLASASLKQLPKLESSHDAIALLKASIDTVVQKENAFPNGMRVSTLWSSILDLTNKTYYFFPENRSDGLRINFSELDFTAGAPMKLNLFEASSIKNR